MNSEPLIHVGITSAPTLQIKFNGRFSTGETVINDSTILATRSGDLIRIEFPGGTISEQKQFIFSPTDPAYNTFTVEGVKIGIEFHWERLEAQTFRGSCSLIPIHDHVQLVNTISTERYLESVISSEMSSASSIALLQAHAITSRSWLLSQLHSENIRNPRDGWMMTPESRIIWYERDAHHEFDVCADDHCQRYHGIHRNIRQSVSDAIKSTRGIVLMENDSILDARYSKSCGGVSEDFSFAWAPIPHPCLSPVRDDADKSHLPNLRDEKTAVDWINGSPPSFCNVDDPNILSQVLVGFDQETTHFYRWEITISQEQLRELLEKKCSITIGDILSMEPVERGYSGRISKLRLTGSAGSMILGKELEIRKALSTSHLYSSAFVVTPSTGQVNGVPRSFHLRGAGWGHGVGLCQIGAAVMSAKGYDYRSILSHYFPGVRLEQIYS